MTHSVGVTVTFLRRVYSSRNYYLIGLRLRRVFWRERRVRWSVAVMRGADSGNRQPIRSSPDAPVCIRAAGCANAAALHYVGVSNLAALFSVHQA